MQQRTLITGRLFGRPILIGLLFVILTGCDWDGNIYLTDDTATSSDDTNNDSESNDSASNGTDSTTSPFDSEHPNDSELFHDTDFDTDDKVELEIFFPSDANWEQLGPDELCGFLILESEELTPFIDIPRDRKRCDHDPFLPLDGPLRIYITFDSYYFDSITEPVFGVAMLYIDTPSDGNPPQPEPGEDYWGFDPMLIFFEPGIGTVRRRIWLSQIPQ